MRSRDRAIASAWPCLPLALVCMLAAVAPCRADAERSAIESSRRATVFISTRRHDALSMGTGFCIDVSGLFITANHVICEKGNYGEISVLVAPGTSDARILNATVVKADLKMDLALLRVERPSDLHAIDLAGIGRLDRLGKALEVADLGYPPELEAVAPASLPQISDTRVKITGLRHVNGRLAEIQFDGSINRGNGGRPLLDQYGSLIGVVTALGSDKQTNLASPVSCVRTLLAEANIVITPAALTEPEVGGPVH